MIETLSEQLCFELLRTTTVGRLGFVEDARVQIIPVNYLVDDRDILIRVTPGGVLSVLPDSPVEVAFEVDFHDDLAGSAWSVLMHGPVSAEEESEPFTGRGSPWAGGARTLLLRLRIQSISGRSVRRERN
ncbi:hypothetical protein DC31_08200 [Microbacterium sp. CH12i]|uniref:pyridoxamine 5'-phosphate oxidase family protein n=1 Tax=Microbacterium sp. CH12i TaxID=1479651 RepID=UPI0004614B9F|nr:pyridoxamine 5'-phosphate oxidase family protein [Microbacterium sp. CH12i]KDA06421.1 hypothetical protein DC31_08200 [Microbacterium sp. CH12i]